MKNLKITNKVISYLNITIYHSSTNTLSPPNSHNIMFVFNKIIKYSLIILRVEACQKQLILHGGLSAISEIKAYI